MINYNNHNSHQEAMRIASALRRSNQSSDADSTASSTASGVEKLLAASGLSALLQSASAAAAKNTYPPHTHTHTIAPTPTHAAAAAAASTSSPSSSLAASLPMLNLLARATNANNLAGGGGGASAAAAAATVSPNALHSALQSFASAMQAANRSAAMSSSISTLGTDLRSMNPSVATAMSSTTISPSSSSSSGSSAVAAEIRPEQIDEALRSKPQRGRKRENLNDYERMELTRTRNREHAKSTRIRKKARHEELLDMEAKFKAAMEAEARNDERKTLIHNFVLLRERGLHAAIEDPAVLESQKHSSVSNPLPLDKVMADNAKFVLGSSSKPVSESSSETGSVDDQESSSCPLRQQLESFDKAMVDKATNCLGKSVIPMLSYSIQGGSDGIALSKLDSGFCQVEMTLAHSLTLLRALVKFEFGTTTATDDPSKIASVRWSTIHDATETGTFERIPPMAVAGMVAAEACQGQQPPTRNRPSRGTISNSSRNSCSSAATSAKDESSSSEDGDGGASSTSSS